MHTYNLATSKAEAGESQIQVLSGQFSKTLPQHKILKRAYVKHSTNHMPSIYKDLGSIPVLENKYICLFISTKEMEAINKEISQKEGKIS